MDVARAKREALTGIYSLLKQNIYVKSCNARPRWQQTQQRKLIGTQNAWVLEKCKI